jgi:hypothetical protein
MGWAVDLAGREQAGGNCEERQGEDGGKETSRTLWCPSRALGKKNKTKQNKKTPPITHTHLPLSSPQGCERQQGNTGNTLHSGEVSVPCRTWQFLTDRTIYGARERDSRGNRDPTKNILPWLHLKKSFCDQFVNFY